MKIFIESHQNTPWIQFFLSFFLIYAISIVWIIFNIRISKEKKIISNLKTNDIFSLLRTVKKIKDFDRNIQNLTLKKWIVERNVMYGKKRLKCIKRQSVNRENSLTDKKDWNAFLWHSKQIVRFINLLFPFEYSMASLDYVFEKLYVECQSISNKNWAILKFILNVIHIKYISKTPFHIHLALGITDNACDI